jgi:integrase
VGRNPNGASTIYKGADGDWHGRVTVGIRDDGRADRRHVRGKTKAEVIRKVRRLEQERDSGRLIKTGRAWTVESWLLHWLEHIARPNLRDTSYSAYRVAVTRHLVPGVGAHRLARLEPEHLEKLYARMMRDGSKAATAHQVHRTARTALAEAVRRGHVTRNVATLAKPPRVTEEEVQPYSIEEVQHILGEAAKRRNSARWAVALALGLRQGEVLALRWRDINLDEATLRVRWTRLRPTYDHGCGGTCGRTHPGWCPRRRVTNGEVGETKSRAGRRVIGLPAQLVELLRAHRDAQAREREAARQLWEEGDWVFANQTGRPLNPNTDYREWKSLLSAAGVRVGRLHDARHTAATVLLLLGVPERVAMGIMGWSTTAMAARYQHVTDPIRQDVAKRVGGLLWADIQVPAR